MSMPNKRKLNHQYHLLKKIPAKFFLILAIFFLVIGIIELRQNNYKMIELRDAVAAADKQNGDVETALRNLREYVYGHMNTNLSSGIVAIKPPIQLKYRYERLVEKENDRVRKYNENVKNKGEKICVRKFPAGGFNSPRVQCVAEYTRVNTIDAATEIPSDLYKFDFVSPAWSPDAAGLSLLASLIFLATFITRAVVGWWYRLELR